MNQIPGNTSDLPYLGTANGNKLKPVNLPNGLEVPEVILLANETHPIHQDPEWQDGDTSRSRLHEIWFLTRKKSTNPDIGELLSNTQGKPEPCFLDSSTLIIARQLSEGGWWSRWILDRPDPEV